MTDYLLEEPELPQGFEYPREFRRVLDAGLVSLEPWWVVPAELARRHRTGLFERYPRRTLVPFARRQDNDDVACFDVDRGGVSVIHDFAGVGWEQTASFASFSAWLHAAVDDLLEW